MNLLLTLLIICGFVLLLCLAIILSGKLLGQSGEVEMNINGQKSFMAKRGEKLLTALSEGDIHLPAACGGKGNCGRCKIKILSGGGPVTSLERIVLTDDELNDSQRLACQVKLREPVKAEVPEELLNAISFKAKLIDIKEVAYKIKTLRFKLEENKKLDFKAGQYVQVCCELPWEKAIRAYSLSSSPKTDDEFSLDVQLVEGGIVSTWLHGCQAGSILDFTGPYGDMYVKDSSSVLLIAGGVGLAPMRSIVSYLIETGYEGKITLFHGVRSKRNLYCEDDYKKLSKKYKNFEYIPVLSEPALEDGWTGSTGLVTTTVGEWLKENTQTQIGMQAYLCGPSKMMEAATSILVMNGVAPENIHSDPFSF